jgi:hypothetical protein
MQGAMKISVTQEDIDQGVPRSPFLCPIALAVRRELDLENAAWLAVLVNISQSCLELRVPDFKRVDLPPEALEFIMDFDIHIKVDPIELEIEGL